jgi:hypothetical protein
MKKVNPAAASGVLASSPTAAESHEIARRKAIRMPAAASQPSGVADGRKPMRRPTPRTSIVENRLRTVLAATWPARIAVPPTSSERKRSMIPPFMSSLTLTAVEDAPKAAQRMRMPGIT